MTPTAPGALIPPSRSLDREPPLSFVALPDELLQLILSFLTTADLKSTSLISRSLYPHATELLWRTVCLRDEWKLHAPDQGLDVRCNRGNGESDEHDDTPMIQTLFLLAKNPHIASKVQVLTHRCHLPTPTIFSELPYIHFNDRNLSLDARTHALIQLAVENLVNVQTLRIVFGHWNITRSLLEGFLSPHRPRRIPLRKLWIESSSLLDAKVDFGAFSQLDGLESIRIRRLRVEAGTGNLMHFPEYRLARGGLPFQLHNGAGGWYTSTVQFSDINGPPRRHMIMPEQMDAKAQKYETSIWDNLPEIRSFLSGKIVIPTSAYIPLNPLTHLLNFSSSTLTKLNLDWMLWRPVERDSTEDLATGTLHALAQMRFPNLRAFQLRNAVVAMTRLPPDIYLLESHFLEFMEAHPKIQCLAWPLDRFYSHSRPCQDILGRARRLVAHLSMVLKDLRIDSYYNNNGESFTDHGAGDVSRNQERARRRRFIAEFAPHMMSIEQIKLEGGIPRDEKREILRALHHCPLKKIVMIGVSFPVGNTWGYRGEDLKDVDEGVGETPDLEEEDTEALTARFADPLPTMESFEFDPCYGWPPGPPFLHDIAAHHAGTVEELKLCGYNGSPVLSNFLPVTRPLLYPLGHFHNLRQLVLSVWLVTYFEDDYRDAEIIQSWMDTRSPSSTALVVVTPPATPSPTLIVSPTVAVHNPAVRPQEFNRWAVALKTRFTPSALAYRVASDIGPYLSPEAKDREGGVRVRASFCLGSRDDQRWANDIFDLDLRIGRNDQVLEFVGPREEGEKGRWWDKLESRRWF